MTGLERSSPRSAQRSLRSLELGARQGHGLAIVAGGLLHVLITDLVMLGMSGRQVREGVRNTGQAFIQKPFSSATLAHKLHDGLGSHSARPPAECGSLS